MPNLAQFHPQIVHFVVGLLFIAVAFRIVSLTGRLSFTNYAATTLLLTGLYSQSRNDRKAGRSDKAADLVTVMAKVFPADTNVRYLHAESLLLDSKNPRSALVILDSISTAPKDARNQSRIASLKADIYVALQRPDSARAVLASVVAAFPQNTRLKAKMDSIK